MSPNDNETTAPETPATEPATPATTAPVDRAYVLEEAGLPRERLADSHRQELDELWQTHGGVGASPYTRDEASEYGHTDDAVVLTAELYDALLSSYQDETIVGEDGHCQFVDWDGEKLTPHAIGRKWLVVVDYHN